jgi:hypothetical protein
MQNGGRGTNRVGKNAEGFFILVKCLDAARAEVDKKAGARTVVHDGGEARCLSVFNRRHDEMILR